MGGKVSRFFDKCGLVIGVMLALVIALTPLWVTLAVCYVAWHFIAKYW